MLYNSLLKISIFPIFQKVQGQNSEEKGKAKPKFYFISGSVCVTVGKKCHREMGQEFVNAGWTESYFMSMDFNVSWQETIKTDRLTHATCTSFSMSTSWTLPCYLIFQFSEGEIQASGDHWWLIGNILACSSERIRSEHKYKQGLHAFRLKLQLCM